MLKVYGFAIFLSAALLFLVQPLAGKILLPLLGGSPAVWNTCMVFFQGVLLLGYLYSHVLTSRLRPGPQVVLHSVVVVGVAVLALPIPIDVGTPTGDPTLWLIRTLTLTVGLPFFVLATSGPLLQRWFSRTDHPDAQDPYFLYAASNAGSMLGLVAYPFLLEPLLTRHEQSWAFTGGFAALAPALGVCGWLLTRRARAEEPMPLVTQAQPVTARRRAMWVVLAMVPSSLMLGVTQHISTDIAAIPLLWIVPLALYLLTFILVFSRRVKFSSAFWGRALVIIAVPVIFTLLASSRKPILVIVLIHLVGFFVASMMCHKRLAEDRPDPRHLTEFYLMMSLGGVLGGAFNALLAPVVFSSLTEFPLMVGLALLLRPQVAADLTESRTRPVLAVAVAVGLGLVLYVGVIAADVLIQTRVAESFGPIKEIAKLNPKLHPQIFASTMLAGLASLAVALLLVRRGSLRFAVAGLLVLLAGQSIGVSGDVLEERRTFFGVHRVTRHNEGRWMMLSHGTTLHGAQARRDGSELGDELSRRPTTYYHPTGPIGDVVRMLIDEGRFKSMAVVGLGAGSMAAYTTPGMTVHFYEIDPAVIDIAADPRYFTYISDALALPGVAIGRQEGDGRLGLAAAPEASYDLIVIDAFSSDAIPIHLMTLEAIAMYRERLKPGGVIAFHISSRYFDLQPVLTRAAAALEMTPVLRDDNAMTKKLFSEVKRESMWLAMARRPEDLGSLMRNTNWQRLSPNPQAPLWTDDYSNPLRVFVGW